jgi:uncharacterized DUF497 family protein
MNYSWGPKKSRRNVTRHGIAFQDAIQIFAGLTLEKLDDRFDYGEVRVYAIGVVNGIEVTAVYTQLSDEERRIISAWRSERHEREAYWKSIGQSGH